ncbi:cupin domain-containing protein [Streptomyces hokutonensis]|uniref:cupin domain-containing protein n=1 Tax=Streptomyces hokutonensis TaxID=1306990 RepID=UPI003806448D
MSFILPQPEFPQHSDAGGGLHVPADAGVSRWVFGDTYTAKLTGQLTNGSLGLVEASVPPGGGPVGHTHAHEDEIFYLLSGELEFLSGERTFTAGPGDVVFIPRTVHHRFRNAGIRPASMLFMYTPGGAEGIFIEGGDEPEAGKAAQMWGPERLPQLADLLVKYGVEVVPEA